MGNTHLNAATVHQEASTGAQHTHEQILRRASFKLPRKHDCSTKLELQLQRKQAWAQLPTLPYTHPSESKTHVNDVGGIHPHPIHASPPNIRRSTTSLTSRMSGGPPHGHRFQPLTHSQPHAQDGESLHAIGPSTRRTNGPAGVERTRPISHQSILIL